MDDSFRFVRSPVLSVETSPVIRPSGSGGLVHMSRVLETRSRLERSGFGERRNVLEQGIGRVDRRNVSLSPSSIV